jgi:hypothetical protein
MRRITPPTDRRSRQDEEGRAPVGARPFLFARRCGKLGEIDERETRMNRMIGAAALLAALAALSACGGAKKDPNALTEEENRQLDNAAEMLDASPDGLAANEDVALGNGDESSAEEGDVEVAENSAGNR